MQLTSTHSGTAPARRPSPITGRSHAGGRLATASVVALAAITSLAACTPPGPTTTGAPSAPSEISTELTTEDVVLDVYVDTVFVEPLKPLTDEFTKQHPNVTFDVKADEFTNVMQNGQKVISSPDAPDLVRYPTVATAAKNGILANLQPYAEAYGWTEWPEGMLAQVKVDSDGNRGSGDLYSLGIGYSVTGVYYNKELAAQIGMEELPQTVADFEPLLEQAKAAGILPIQAWGKDGGTAYPLQSLMHQFGENDELKQWLFQKPDATIDLDSTVKAAGIIQDWARKGHFPSDVNAVDYTAGVGRFESGEGLFMFNGDWEAVNAYKKMGENVGFFLMPGNEPSAPHYAMQAPVTFVIPKTADNPDVTAYFLNWIHTDETARQLVLESTGQSPGGPADLPQPTPVNDLQADTTAAFATVSEDDGAMDFIANATAGIYATSLIPNLQLLLSERSTPEEFAAALQADYEAELGR